jgi:6-phosphogluconolactonase
LDVELVVTDDWAAEAAERVASAARSAAQIVLSGGSTPRRAYELAAERAPDWRRASVWWGDERCVPPDDERSNYRLAREALLDRLQQPPAAVHRIRGELDPEEAAGLYDAELDGVELDLVLLGLGSDGHTASLFPNAATLEESERRAVAADAGLEPFVPRVTMTVPVLCSAALVVFLAAGEDKAEAAARAFAEPPNRATPASLVRSRSGRTLAILDRPAARKMIE